jgi:uncharacterized membrane protein
MTDTQPSRHRVADLLKGTAVVLMIQVHVLQLLVRQDVMESATGRILLFLGGPPVAPVFLAVMGFYAISASASWAAFLLRGCRLLALGLLLNLGLNAHLLLRIYSGEIALDPWRYVFGVDVLFAAGLSMMVIAVLRPVLAQRGALWLALAGLVALVTPEVDAALPRTDGWRWLTAYLGDAAPWSYFPLFPWLAYVLAGAAAGCWRQRLTVSRAHVALLCSIGAVILWATGDMAFEVATDLPRYYHHGAGFFCWTVAFMAVWTGGHRIVAPWVDGSGVWVWLGRHVTLSYVIQWLLIGNIATAIYRSETLLHGGLWFVTVLSLVVVATREITRWRTRNTAQS